MEVAQLPLGACAGVDKAVGRGAHADDDLAEYEGPRRLHGRPEGRVGVAQLLLGARVDAGKAG